MEYKDILTPIIISEKHYTGDDHKGSSVHGSHTIIKGEKKVLISASRGIRHKVIENEEKENRKAHVYTASLADSIADSGAYAIIKTNDTEDDLAQYNKELLNTIIENDIAFFIDLRGGIKNQKSGIIIGDGELEYIEYNEEFRRATEELFNSFGISVKFSKTYQAKKPVAPANIVYQKTGIPSVQFLINIDYRDPRKNLDKYLSLNAALNKYILLSMIFFNSHTYKK